MKTKERIANALLKCGQEIFLALQESVTTDESSPSKLMFTRQEAAERLSVSPSTIDNWRKDGTLQAVKPFGPEGESRYTPRAIAQVVRRLENGHAR